MANKFRGEVIVTLGGTEYLMRPTFEAMVEFEDRAGATAYEMLGAAVNKNHFPIKHVAAAFHAGIKAAWPVEGKRCPSFAEIGQMIRSDGLHKSIAQYTDFLQNSLSSDADLELAKEREAKGKVESVQAVTPA